MTIQNKLLSGYLIIAMVAISVGYLSALATKELNHTFDTITLQTVPIVDAINDLRYHAARALGHSGQLALILSPSQLNVDLAHKQSEERELEDTLASFSTTFDHYKMLVSQHQAEHSRIVQDTLISTSETLLQMLRELLHIKQGRILTNELLRDMEEVEDYENTFLSAVHAALALEVEQLKMDRKAVLQAIERTRNIAMVFGPVSVLIAVLITMYFSHIMTTVLLALKNASLAVASGNWNIRVSRVAKSEFNDVIQTFNDMASALHSKAVKGSMSEIYYHEILDTMPESVIVTSLDGKIKTVNKAIVNLIKYSKEELIGNSVMNIIGQQCRTEITDKWLLKLAKGNSIIHARTIYLTSDQQEIPMLVSIAYMRGHSSTVDAIIYIGMEITEQMLTSPIGFPNPNPT